MARENVGILETVRRAIAAVNARDVEGYLSLCTPDVELHTPVEAVGGAYVGTEGIRRFFADIEDAGPDFHLAIHDLQALATGCVLAAMSVASTGRSSGIPVGAETTNVYWFAEDRINCIRVFRDRAEALDAVGLEE